MKQNLKHKFTEIKQEITNTEMKTQTSKPDAKGRRTATETRGTEREHKRPNDLLTL